MNEQVLRLNQIKQLPKEEQAEHWKNWNERKKTRKKQLIAQALQTFQELCIDYRYSERNHLFIFWANSTDRIFYWASTGSWQVRRDRQWNGTTYKCKNAADLLAKIDKYQQRFGDLAVSCSDSKPSLPRRKVVSKFIAS